MSDHPPLSTRPIFASSAATVFGWLSSVSIDHFTKLLYCAGALITIAYSIWKWAVEWRDRRRRERARLTTCARCPNSPDNLSEESAR